jgi:TolB-like protein/class 3 adenylate cyclase/Tfp pilus assembly protein PilF
MSQSRQLAAIMFTDIVGYTSLMGKDEKRAFDLLKKNREIQKPLIKQYHGTWIKELGDGVLASFQTVTDAVFCAAAIHHASNNVEGLKLRIGIHLGEVIFENNDVFGDGVNIASRLQAMASIGSTWVSEAVYKNLVNKKEITSEFVKEETLKNVSEPVKVYEISVKEIPGYLPDNIKSYQKSSNDEKSPRKKAFYIAGILVLVAIVGVYFLFFNKQSKSGSAKNGNMPISIAVLYFDNMTGDKAQEYLSDGLTEEITSRLAKIKGLRVTSRTSVLPYKGKAVSLKQIAEELKVTTLLEGSVRKAGNTVRITAQLIDGNTNSHFWSQDFTRELKDIFQLQSDVAHTIAKKLELKVSGEASEKISKASTTNIDAYDQYLKARHIAFNQYYYIGDSLAFERAREMYEKAIGLDKDFGLAYAGLADLYDAKRLNGDRSYKVDSLRQSLSLKAYQLDPNSAFVNNVRIWMMANRDIPLMDSAMYYAARAYQLEPDDYYNCQSIASLFAVYYINLFQLAIPFYEKAVELNPLDIVSYASLGNCYYVTGDSVKANKAFQSAYELTKSDPYVGIWWVFDWLVRQNRLQEAEQLYQRQGAPMNNSQKVHLLIARGQQEEALRLLSKMKDAAIKSWYYAHLNKKDDVIREMKLIPPYINFYLYLLIEPYKKFHNDPEFQKILAQQKELHETYAKQYGKYLESLNR